MGEGLEFCFLHTMRSTPPSPEAWRNAPPLRGSMFGGGSVETDRCEPSAIMGSCLFKLPQEWLSSTNTPPLPRPTPGVSVNAQVACHQCSFRPRPAELAAGRSTLSLTPSSSGDSTRRGDTVAAARLLIWQVDGARAFGSVLASPGEGTGCAAALRRSHEAGGLWMFPMPSRPC